MVTFVFDPPEVGGVGAGAARGTVANATSAIRLRRRAGPFPRGRADLCSAWILASRATIRSTPNIPIPLRVVRLRRQPRTASTQPDGSPRRNIAARSDPMSTKDKTKFHNPRGGGFARKDAASAQKGGYRPARHPPP